MMRKAQEVVKRKKKAEEEARKRIEVNLIRSFSLKLFSRDTTEHLVEMVFRLYFYCSRVPTRR